MLFFFKTLVAALIIAGTSELAKRSSLVASILISLPLTSIVAILFVYFETKDNANISQLSMSIFWMVLPSLCFFVMLSKLLEHGFQFWISLITSAFATAAIYCAYTALLSKMNVKL